MRRRVVVYVFPNRKVRSERERQGKWETGKWKGEKERLSGKKKKNITIN